MLKFELIKVSVKELEKVLNNRFCEFIEFRSDNILNKNLRIILKGKKLINLILKLNLIILGNIQ